MSTYNDRASNVAIELDRIENEIRNLKSTQLVGGSSLVLYNNQTANTWDIVGDAISMFGSESYWLVQFYPEDGPVTYAELGVNWQITTNPTIFDKIYVWDSPPNVYSSTSNNFIVWYQNNFNYNQTINFKFEVTSVSPGTVVWSRLV